MSDNIRENKYFSSIAYAIKQNNILIGNVDTAGYLSSISLSRTAVVVEIQGPKLEDPNLISLR